MGHTEKTGDAYNGGKELLSFGKSLHCRMEAGKPLSYLLVGKYTSWSVFILGIVYAIATLIGLASVSSPAEQIGQPFLAVMEWLIMLIAPLMAVSMVAVHYSAGLEDKFYSLTAFFLMSTMAAITSCVHFVMLTVADTEPVKQLPGHSLILSFQWPSVAYALDILAWDWFFALSMFSAAFVFKTGTLEKAIRLLMLFAALLSLFGLFGAPLGNMQLRNVGILGYGLFGPVIFLLIGIHLNRKNNT